MSVPQPMKSITPRIAPFHSMTIISLAGPIAQKESVAFVQERCLESSHKVCRKNLLALFFLQPLHGRPESDLEVCLLIRLPHRPGEMLHNPSP